MALVHFKYYSISTQPNLQTFFGLNFKNISFIQLFYHSLLDPVIFSLELLHFPPHKNSCLFSFIYFPKSGNTIRTSAVFRVNAIVLEASKAVVCHCSPPWLPDSVLYSQTLSFSQTSLTAEPVNKWTSCFIVSAPADSCLNNVIFLAFKIETLKDFLLKFEILWILNKFNKLHYKLPWKTVLRHHIL